MKQGSASSAPRHRTHKRKAKTHLLAAFTLAVGGMVSLSLALGVKAVEQPDSRIEWPGAEVSSRMDTGVSEATDTPDAPDTPDTPDTPATPATPDTPATPVAPAAPVAPATPVAPAAPANLFVPADGTKSLTEAGGAADGQRVAAAQQTDPGARQTPAPQSGVSAEGWNLALVNPWNALPDAYPITLVQLKNGQSVDERCYPDLQAMMDDCRAAGLSPLICSSYRTQEKQETLFQNKVNQFMAQGYTEDTAKTEAAKIVAVPGTSEHQLGLALDIVDLNHQNLDKTQEDTAVQKWLIDNSWRYGFILRYPNGKSDITGIIYEPWHYRYVGRDVAKEIYEQDICLEEYLAQQEA